MQDRFGRTVDYLRVALTDRCNLKCWYCVGRGGYQYLTDAERLSYEELVRVLRMAVERVGITKIRLTGGEPLLYEPLEQLIRWLRSLERLRELTLSTNGVLLAEKAAMLRRAGVDRVNVSLEGASDEVYRQITGRNCLQQVLAGLGALLKAGYDKPKLNIVLCRAFGRDELRRLLDIGQRYASELRFIELMGYNERKNPSAADITREFSAMGTLRSVCGSGTATQRYTVAGYDVVLGMIPSRTKPFCANCGRVRLASDGQLRTCLFTQEGVQLRPMLRNGSDDEELVRVMRESIFNKPRYAVGNEVRMACVGG